MRRVSFQDNTTTGVHKKLSQDEEVKQASPPSNDLAATLLTSTIGTRKRSVQSTDRWAAALAKKIAAHAEDAENLEQIITHPVTSEKEANQCVVKLSRNDRGLGLVFDSNFRITRMLPGCAASEHGQIGVGDRLLAVDGRSLQLGDSIATFFPFGQADRVFELKLEKKQKEKGGAIFSKGPDRIHKEPSGKFYVGRPGPVFEEVQWNEYCVLLPDGMSRPFNEDVRYTSLTGYLRKRKVLKDGRADFAICNGESSRGWQRHFIHLSIQKLAWFDEDPQKDISMLGTLKLAFSNKVADSWIDSESSAIDIQIVSGLFRLIVEGIGDKQFGWWRLVDDEGSR